MRELAAIPAPIQLETKRIGGVASPTKTATPPDFVVGAKFTFQRQGTTRRQAKQLYKTSVRAQLSFPVLEAARRLSSRAFVRVPNRGGRDRDRGRGIRGGLRDAHGACVLRAHAANALRVRIERAARALRADDDHVHSRELGEYVVHCCARPDGRKPTPQLASESGWPVKIL